MGETSLGIEDWWGELGIKELDENVNVPIGFSDEGNKVSPTSSALKLVSNPC